MWTAYSKSLISPGEGEVICRTTTPSENKSPVLYVHGAGEIGHGWMNISTRWPVISAIADAGYIVTSHDLGGHQTWGNDTAISRITSAYNYAQNYSGVVKGKVVLVAQSMGGLNSILWAARNPEKVACMVLLMPVIDLGEVRSTPGGYQQLIDTALGVTYSDQAHGLARSPIIMARAGVHPKVPCQLWYGTSDELCRPGKAIEYGNLSGATVKPIAGGHAEQTIAGVSPSEVLQFIRANE